MKNRANRRCNYQGKPTPSPYDRMVIENRKLREKLNELGVEKWQPIESAPKDRAILISENGCKPHYVEWVDERPEREINGNRWLAIPEGWFYVTGSRSHFSNPTHWLEIPKPPREEI